MPAFLTNGRQQYSINKSKALLGFVGQQWEQHIVAELDSALNKWVDSVPDHRTSLVNQLLLILNLCDASAMGPASRGRGVFPSVSYPLCQLLPPPDPRTPPFYSVTPKALGPVLSLACNLYECCQVVQPSGRLLERKARTGITSLDGDPISSLQMESWTDKFVPRCQYLHPGSFSC